MTTPPHLALPLIAAAQAQKHVTHNEALLAVDTLLHCAVKDKDLAAPPASPAEGDRYIRAGTASAAQRPARRAAGRRPLYRRRRGDRGVGRQDRPSRDVAGRRLALLPAASRLDRFRRRRAAALPLQRHPLGGGARR